MPASAMTSIASVRTIVGATPALNTSNLSPAILRSNPSAI
jgi:hypothetical protein